LSPSAHPPRKRFGQNFLQDQTILQKMKLSICAKESDHLVEIGPGLGALTSVIIPECHHFDAIELDRDLIEKLKAQFADHAGFTLYQADALQFDFSSLGSREKKIRVIGNLPYNISTPLLFHLLHYASYIKDMHFLLQKEVVDRITAKPGNKNYGRLSVMMQYYCHTLDLFSVAPEAFYPAPKVMSAFVRLVPHDSRPYTAINVKTLQSVVRQAFSQRRKTLNNNLKKIISKDELIALHIDPSLRPEKLSIEEFVSISNAIELKSTAS